MTRLNRQKLSTLNRDEAEIIALKSITFLAEDPKRLLRYLSLTGIDLQELRASTQQVSSLVAALNYLHSDESLLLMFASNHALSVKVICQARDILQSKLNEETNE